MSETTTTETLTAEEIDLIDRRRDHLLAMANSLVNGEPADEVVLSAATVAQAANDLRRLLTALDALREELAEAYASRDHYVDRAIQRLQQVERVRALAKDMDHPYGPTVLAALAPLIPEGTVELRYGENVVGRIEKVGDDA